jgi:prevent-host-death family protein
MMVTMTLQAREYEVGVRELHDRLSEHLERVEQGATLVVTRRGRRIARLSSTDLDDPLEDLVRRGLVTAPTRIRSPRHARVKATGSVSELVGDQRR